LSCAAGRKLLATGSSRTQFPIYIDNLPGSCGKRFLVCISAHVYELICDLKLAAWPPQPVNEGAISSLMLARADLPAHRDLGIAVRLRVGRWRPIARTK